MGCTTIFLISAETRWIATAEFYLLDPLLGFERVIAVVGHVLDLLSVAVGNPNTGVNLDPSPRISVALAAVRRASSGSTRPLFD